MTIWQRFFCYNQNTGWYLKNHRNRNYYAVFDQECIKPDFDSDWFEGGFVLWKKKTNKKNISHGINIFSWHHWILLNKLVKDNDFFVQLIFDGVIDTGLVSLVQIYSFRYIMHILYLQAHFAFITVGLVSEWITGIFYASLV